MTIHAGPPGHATITGRIPRVERRATKTVRIAFPTSIDAPDPQTWRLDAACRDADPELFFAPDYERARETARREAAAKLVCDRCPVSQLCRAWAIAANELGYWGGTNELDRRRAERKATRKRTAKPRLAMASVA